MTPLQTLDLICMMLFAYGYVWFFFAAATWSMYHVLDLFGTGDLDVGYCILDRYRYKWDSKLFYLYLYRCGRKIQSTESVGRRLYNKIHGRHKRGKEHV